MSSSPIKARVPFPTFFDAADAPTDTYYAQILSNNALHLADQNAKVRVNYSPPSGGAGSSRESYLTTETIAAVDTYQIVATFGPFPVSMRSDGPYSMRVRIAGAMSAAGDGKLAAVWSTPATAARDLVLLGSNVITMDLASATPAWKAGAVEILTLSDSQVLEATRTLSTPLEFGGDPSAVSAVMTTITVYGQSDNVSKKPRLSALYAAELAP